MIIGQFESILDTKKRTAVPKKFRSELGSDIILTKGLDKNLIIVPELQWRTLLEGTDGRPFIETNVRDLQRFLLGNASQIQLDTKGRIVIPEYLRKYAHLNNQIVFVGVGRYVEIWDQTMWYDHQMKLTENDYISKIAEKLVRAGDE